MLCIKMFLIRDMACNHYSDKDMFMSFRNLMYMIQHIDASTDSTNMMFKEKNENVIIMKYYAK